MRVLTAAVAALAVSLSSVRAEVYQVDPVHSTIGFGVKHMVVTTVKGSFRDFAGTVEYDAANPSALKVSGRVQTASINTANEKRDAHLRSPDFFDAGSFPEIVYESTRMENGVLYGNLTIRGVTKEIAMPVTVNGPVNHPSGDKVVIGLEGTTKINRQDFGVTWSKVMDGGGLVVGDDVTLDIAIEAAR